MLKDWQKELSVVSALLLPLRHLPRLPLLWNQQLKPWLTLFLSLQVPHLWLHLP
jgi:hypothetical protein